MTSSLNRLNPQQRQAVTHTDGPLLIIAGAGTGKTTVLTQRIQHIIKTQEVKPSSVAALTFTEKAATEMLERVDQAMPYGYEEPWICTFHSFCDRLLRIESLEIGLAPDYRIISPAQQWILLKTHLFDLGLDYYAPLNNPNKFLHALITFFSRLQDEDVHQEEISAFLAQMKRRQERGRTRRVQEIPRTISRV